VQRHLPLEANLVLVRVRVVVKVRVRVRVGVRLRSRVRASVRATVTARVRVRVRSAAHLLLLVVVVLLLLDLVGRGGGGGGGSGGGGGGAMAGGTRQLAQHRSTLGARRGGARHVPAEGHASVLEPLIQARADVQARGGARRGHVGHVDLLLELAPEQGLGVAQRIGLAHPPPLAQALDTPLARHLGGRLPLAQEVSS